MLSTYPMVWRHQLSKGLEPRGARFLRGMPLLPPLAKTRPAMWGELSDGGILSLVLCDCFMGNDMQDMIVYLGIWSIHCDWGCLLCLKRLYREAPQLSEHHLRLTWQNIVLHIYLNFGLIYLCFICNIRQYSRASEIFLTLHCDIIHSINVQSLENPGVQRSFHYCDFLIFHVIVHLNNSYRVSLSTYSISPREIWGNQMFWKENFFDAKEQVL